jgi:ParB family chromosome partitioning protein
MSERRLGRGLEALLGPLSKDDAEQEGVLREVPVDALRPNPYQPRRELDETALGELAASIQASGLLQPVLVREDNGSYQLIAGERRWRAIQMLGWKRIPVVVRPADDRTLLTLALIENLQRDDLNPIDEALGYERLISEFELSANEVARVVGRDRSTVANTLRLLKLPATVQVMVQHGALSAGHARALLGLGSAEAMRKMAQRAEHHGWSVRELEAQVGRGASKRRRAGGGGPHAASVEARQIEDVLRQHLGTDVRLTAKRKGRGQLAISYYTNEDLGRLLELILGHPYEG